MRFVCADAPASSARKLHLQPETCLSEGGVAGEQRAVCVKNLCGRRHVNAGIADQEDDAVVNGVLECQSSSETQSNTSCSPRAVSSDPTTTEKRAWPAP